MPGYAYIERCKHNRALFYPCLITVKVYTGNMNILYDQPRPSMKLVTGDIVEIHDFITAPKKLFRKATQTTLVSYGVIIDFVYDGGYTAIINVSGRVIRHAPEDLKLVQRVENRASELIDEIEEFLSK